MSQTTTTRVQVTVEVIEAPLTQPQPELYRAGLPPERLRKVWAEWEDEEGDVVTFKDEHYHWSNWRASMPIKRIHDHAWSGLKLKPLGTSWSRVEAMADATEKPKCPACGKKPDRDTRPLSAGEYVTCQSCGLYLRVVDGAWQIVRPVENCGHVAADGTCAHPNAQTPECHDGVVCPAKAEKLAEPKMLDLRELPVGTVCEATGEIGERPRAGDLHSMHMAYKAGLAYGKGEADAG